MIEGDCNQNLKAIQAEMISEQKSFRKLLKPIISVVEHKAPWSFFFFFFKEGEKRSLFSCTCIL
jgi:hypothetical protein